MYDGRFIDFGNATQNAIAQFLPGLHTNVSEEGAGHFAEQRFNNIEPGTMSRRVHVLEAIGSGEGRKHFAGPPRGRSNPGKLPTG